MSSKVDAFLEKTLGEDFLESLEKTELWKPTTKSVNDIEDMRIGLKIVPRVIMSFLVRELAPMKVGESKELVLPLPNAGMKVTKHERDQYTGAITEDNKVVVDFKYRSIPGLGLVIMSCFELYNVENLNKESIVKPDIEEKVQKLIDERMALHDLVGKVVDKRIAEKEAVQKLVLSKLTELVKINKESTPQEDPYFRGMTNGLAVADAVANNKKPDLVGPPKKELPLEKFLKNRQKKREFSVEMKKGEIVNCPDCGNKIFDDSGISACICFGDSGKIYLKKTENGIKLSFSKNWDVDNIEMLLKTLRGQNE